MSSKHTNRIVESLPNNERNYFLKHSRPVDLLLGTTLCEAGKTIQHVYFPIDGFISQPSSLGDHSELEMGLIGDEGMLGATLLLGEKIAPTSAIVQGAGSALSMSASQMRRALCQNPKLLRSLNHYLFSTMQQWAQSAFCAHFHQTGARLSRLLLMAHDRGHHSTFYITQDTLAKLLGVRRSSVTVAASELQKKKLIQYRRGKIDVIDRPGLKAVACLCYSFIGER